MNEMAVHAGANVDKKITVFVVDDSALVRSALSLVLAKAPHIQVIGTASNPNIALTKMNKQWPDVIISDLEMPEMHGLQFLEYLNKNHPTPFIVCSSYAGAGVQASIDALALGAIDIICKPNLGVESYLAEITNTIIDSVTVAANFKPKSAPQSSDRVFKSSPATKPQLYTSPAVASQNLESLSTLPDRKSFSVIAIGSSTGGTTVIEHFLRLMPENCPPILIVQHMPMYFTDAFARRLNNFCRVAVKEAQDGEALEPGKALIAPGGRHMELVRGSKGYVVKITDGPQFNRHKPSVDVLFNSVADTLGKYSLGIILTGMGRDGAQGLLRMRDKGAVTIAQDEASSAVYGMPKAAVEVGAVENSLSFTEIGYYLEKTTNKVSGM